jgi:hypothetical protein
MEHVDDHGADYEPFDFTESLSKSADLQFFVKEGAFVHIADVMPPGYEEWNNAVGFVVSMKGEIAEVRFGSCVPESVRKVSPGLWALHEKRSAMWCKLDKLTPAIVAMKEEFVLGSLPIPCLSIVLRHMTVSGAFLLITVTRKLFFCFFQFFFLI